MMRRRTLSLLLLALTTALLAVAAGPAGAYPNKTSTCTGCHSGTASGSVTAVPSTSTPAAGAAYTVNLSIGLTAGGNTGYHVAQTDAAGTSTTWLATAYAGPAAQTTWTVAMTAPATPGAYYYKVWAAKGSASSSGMAKAATYSITVPAATPTPTPTPTVTPTITPTPTPTPTQPAVDTVAPVTSAGGVPVEAWCNSAVALSLSATDTGGSGVSQITYSVDGGASVAVSAPSATVPLNTSGAHTVTFFARDAAGNVEQVKSLTVNIDLGKPQPKALRAAKARRGGLAKLSYKVLDELPNGGTATVTIAIKNKRGVVVKRLTLGAQPVNTALAARFTCKLRPGTYRFFVRATDAAGNVQASVASQTLRVLAAR